jgi:hypothetical protein
MKFSVEAPHNDVDDAGVIHVHLRIRRSSMVGGLVMLLLHGLLLYLVLHAQSIIKIVKGPGDKEAIVYVPDLVREPQSPKPAKTPTKPQAVTQTKPATPRPTSAPPVTDNAPVAQPVTPAPPDLDMSAMIEQRRKARQAAEPSPAPTTESSGQSGRERTANERAQANVRRSQEQANGSGGGLFQVTGNGVRERLVSFRGWDGTSRQSFKVDAGLGGDIEKAVVRRIISMIRERFKGDFTWVTRYNREVQLSARPEDDAQLEAYLMKEFFGYEQR